MKRFLKYACVWLVLMIGIVLAVGYYLPKKAGELMLTPALNGYTEKMVFPVEEPKDEAEEKQCGGMLLIRALLSDNGGKAADDEYGYFMLKKYSWNESYVFLNPQGAHDFSYGAFAYVYHETAAEEASHTAHPVGLIDLGAFTMLEGASAMREALAAHPDAVVRLDAYTVQDYLVKPAKITLTDDAGQVLFTQDFAADGDVIQAEDCRICNDYEADDLYSGLYGKLRYVNEGDHSSAEKAADIAKELLNGKTVSAETETGIARISEINIYEANGYRMVHVSETRWDGVWYYIVMIGMIVTCVLAVIYILRKRKQGTD